MARPAAAPEKQTRNRRTPEQKAQASVDQAQKAVDQANKRLEKATERQNKLAEDVASAQAEAQQAQAALDYAKMHPALQNSDMVAEDAGGAGETATATDDMSVSKSAE